MICKILNRLVSLFYRNRFNRLGRNSKIHYQHDELVGLRYISVGDNTFFGKGISLTAWDLFRGSVYNPVITIGNRCHFGKNNLISSCNRIEIGDDLLTGRNVTITDNAHGKSAYVDLQLAPIMRSLHSKGPVKIGNNVWIGNNAVILPGVNIGNGAIIGANSVVTHNIPDYAIAAGVPARIVKQLEP